MKQHITIYEVPLDMAYIERFKLDKLKKIDNIDHTKPCIVVINDSFYHYGKEFMLVYNHTIQTTGSGGSCYNPCHKDAKTNKFITESIGKYWSRNKIYSSAYILSRVCAAKCYLLEKLGLKYQIPWYSNIKEYQSGMFGVLIAKIDAIGMGYASPSILENITSNRTQKLLT